MLRRMAIVPFEMAIAAFIMISGVTGLLHFGVIDPFDALLPHWEIISLNCGALLSGLLMMTGVASDKGKIELAGLLFLNGLLICRFLTYGHFLGYGSGFIQTGFFDGIILLSSVVRANGIRSAHTIVRLKDGISGYS